MELCCTMALPFCNSCSCISISFLLFWWPAHSGWYITEILPQLEDYINSSTCIYQYHCFHVVPDSSLSSESACFSTNSLFSNCQMLLAVRPFLLLKDMFAYWNSVLTPSRILYFCRHLYMHKVKIEYSTFSWCWNQQKFQIGPRVGAHTMHC
jgi:hypothetical protein